MLYRLRPPTLYAAILLGLLASPCGHAQTAPAEAHPHFAVETTDAGPHVLLLPGLGSGPTTWTPTLCGPVRDTSAVAVLLADNGGSDAGAFAQAFAEMQTTDAGPDLPRVVVPALVVVAGYGTAPVTPTALYARPYVGLARAEIEAVPRSLYFVTYDQGEAMLALLNPLLARTLPAPAP